ncbi:MAG: hypothetical protein GY801_20035 [bacterium]|nr:hypothetical protein [bacterium]
MKEDVIRQVKNAEDQAEEKIRDAQSRAEKVLLNARHEAVESRMEIVGAARAKSKKFFEEGLEGFEPELAKIRQQYQDSIAKDREKADKEFEKVVEFVLTSFHKKLGEK